MNLKDHRKFNCLRVSLQLALSSIAHEVRAVNRELLPCMTEDAAARLVERLDKINYQLCHLSDFSADRN